LEECEECNTALERMAGGPDWCAEAVSQLTADELDEPVPIRDEWSEADFTVEHLEPTDEPNVLGRLGGYDVLEIIGHGGMGVVLKGFDRELKRCVAIKVLAPHLARSSLARQRFAREAQAAAAVVHPNVLAIHQVQPNGRLPFLVMPLVAGESLAERLVAQGKLELKETLRIGMQAAAGLAAAHEQGLVHRDVKPANILLEKGVERAVLTDFGLARAADDVTLTRWGFVAGTPQYMSPEQAWGELLDCRSDLFSLGCVLYEMATGVSPFRCDSMMGTMRRLVDDQPQPMASLNPELPPWFIAIVERLLEKEPSRRFGSAQEVSELLEGCLAHVQQPANVPMPAGLPRPAARRASRSSRIRIAGVIAMIATVVIGLFGTVLLSADPPDIAGTWSGDEWGDVVLKETSSGEYSGTYVAPSEKRSGEIQVKWSRIERRFNGTWREGEDRFGELTLRRVGDEIRGAHKTDPKSKNNPSLPTLAEITWQRAGVPQALGGGIELIALSEYPNQKTWWRADGRPLPEPPVDSINLDLRALADPKLRWYTALFRIPGGLDSDVAGDRIQGTKASWIWLGRQHLNSRRVNDLEALAIALPADDTQAALAIEVAQGNWRTIAAVEGQRFLEKETASESDTEWQVMDRVDRFRLFVDYPPGNVQSRIAFRRGGEITFAKSFSEASPNAGRTRIEAQFSNVDLARGTFILQTRPFKKVEFREVVLQLAKDIKPLGTSAPNAASGSATTSPHRPEESPKWKIGGSQLKFDSSGAITKGDGSENIGKVNASGRGVDAGASNPSGVGRTMLDFICQEAFTQVEPLTSLEYTFETKDTEGWHSKAEFHAYKDRFFMKRVDVTGLMVLGKRLDPMTCSSAFDGVRQQYLDSNGRLRLKAGAEGAAYTNTTPELAMYMWLRNKPGDWRWDSVRNKDLWDKRFAAATYIGAIPEPGRTLEIVDFPQQVEGLKPCVFRVFFARELGFAPVKFIRRNAATTEISTVMHVTDFKTLVQAGKAYWLPLSLSVTESGADGVSRIQELTMTVSAASIKVNEPVDESLFTIPETLAKEVYDVDLENALLEAVGPNGKKTQDEK
jgi:serine/threonine-protein kinase